jgi:hypothetical protein
MFNIELVERIIAEYGMINTLQFCKMESFKYEQLEKYYHNMGFKELFEESNYEKEWWAVKAQDIELNLKQQMLK